MRSVLACSSAVRGDQAGVAGRGEVLGRIEREAAEIAPASRALALVVRADALRAVFDQEELFLLADARDVSRSAHCPNRCTAMTAFVFLPMSFLQRSRVQVEGPLLHVREHRRRAGIGHRLAGGEEGESRNDHFVARPDAGGDERESAARRCPNCSRRRAPRRRIARSRARAPRPRGRARSARSRTRRRRRRRSRL